MNKAHFLLNDNQSKTIESITPVVDGKLYSMNYLADYYLDAAIASNLKSLSDFRKFAAVKLLDGSKMAAALKSVGAGCSVFTGRTDDKQPILCRNYDFSHDLTGLMLRCEPAGGYKSIGMCDLGFMDMPAGCFEDGKTDLSPLMLAPYITVDGINEKGFAIAALALGHDGVAQDTGKTKINATIAIRMLLDRAANVKEAIELLSSYDVSSPLDDMDFHFMLLDASGVSKVAEYCQNELKIYDARYVANAYLTPYMGEQIEMTRYNMMREFVIHHKAHFNEDEAFCMLRCVQADKTRDAGTSLTRWSGVMNTAAKTYNLYYDRDYNSLYKFSV